MPIYTYECSRCGAVTDKLKKIDEANEPVKCEFNDCGGAMSKIFSSKGSFELKGKGWFKTDGKY